MTHARTLRLARPLLLVAVAASAVLALPASAHAILVGAESNRELVNTTQTPALQGEALDKMQRQGAQVVRANFRWYEIADGCDGQTLAALENPDNACYNWGRLDSFVQQANDRGIQVLVSLTQNPSWANGNSNPYFMGSTSAQFTKVLDNYVAFHKAVAKRYRAGSNHGVIKYLTIHNEPNSKFYWAPAPNAQRYAQLYARTAVAVRSVNAGVQLAPGPTGPTGGSGGIKPLVFLRTFQSYISTYLPGSGAAERKYLNAWAHNPYPGIKNQPSVANRTSDPNAITMATIDRLGIQLDKHPTTRGAKIWATEFGWETPPENKYNVTQVLQAQFVAEAFDWLDSKQRVAIGINYGLSDPSEIVDWQSGTFTNAGVAKLSFYMYQRMVSVPQGGISGRVKGGSLVRVWGRSNIAPATQVLSYRVINGRCRPTAPINAFCAVKPQMTLRGAKVSMVRIPRGQALEFKTYDDGKASIGIDPGYGPGRIIRGI